MKNQANARPALTTASMMKPASHEVSIGAQVQVTYQLSKSADLELFEIEFGELYEPVGLDDDYISPTSYRSKDDKTYASFLNDQGQLKVRLYCRGQAGLNWSMTVQVNGNAIPSPQPKKTLTADGFDTYEIAHNI